MIADSSALLAILFREPTEPGLRAALSDADSIGVGAPTLAETAAVLGHRLGFEQVHLLHRLIQAAQIQVIPVGEDHWIEATEAYRRFGKGRHPAALNFGDCLSYATARLARQPLLCVGQDFPQTDLDLVPLP